MLNYRSPQDTVRCVHALRKQSIADQLEIIVVDNHSEDDSIGVIRNRLAKLPSVHIIETSQNLGYGQGNGFGTRFAQGQYILITNPDHELEPRGLVQLIHTMEEDASIGIIAPKLVHEDGSRRDSARAFPTLLDVFIKRTKLATLFPLRMHRYLQHDLDLSKPADTDWVVGAVLLMRRELFARLGGFDPRFFLFFEDADLCRRIRSEGLRVVYDPQVTAHDRKRRLSEGGVLSLLRRKTGRIHIMSALKYFWKWRKQT